MPSNKKKTILCVFGTRPELIKMAPIIFLIRSQEKYRLRILCTGQHSEILNPTLNLFQITPDYDLKVMEKNQSLAYLTSKLSLPIDEILEKEKPNLVLVQGDTISAFLVALLCFYRQIPVGHIEAGLRTGNFAHPFPEEMDRLLISKLASFHFAPTEDAKANLLKENTPPESIFVTGNTAIDALKMFLSRPNQENFDIDEQKKLLLVTLHRRESHGVILDEICSALRELTERNENLQILLPMHPSPQVRSSIQKFLKDHPRIHLKEPLRYDHFVHLMQKAHFILSDSGGIQEEASFLGIPVLVLRKTTERPEVAKIGTTKVIGTEKQEIIRMSEKLLQEPSFYRTMSTPCLCYGNGDAASKILGVVNNLFK